MLLANVYKSIYDLTKEPFNITPDPEFLYFGSSHLEALASLAYGIEQRKGFIALTGEVGVGKTTVIRSYLQNINSDETFKSDADNEIWATIRSGEDKDKLRLVYVFHANVSFISLLKFICDELDITHETDDSFVLVNLLYEKLIAEYAEDRNIVVIIDEAQNMPIETLENLRMLSNLETSKDKLIQIVLVGQPELERMLELKELRQLNQRIAIRSRILPLTKQESQNYIDQRLREAGTNIESIFTKDAIKTIVKYSKGIPRIINTVCHNSLIAGIGYKRKPIVAKIVREVIADIDGKSNSRVWNWVIGVIIFLFVLMPWGFSRYWTESQDGLFKKARIPKPASSTAETPTSSPPQPMEQAPDHAYSVSSKTEQTGENHRAEVKPDEAPAVQTSQAPPLQTLSNHDVEKGEARVSNLPQPAFKEKEGSHQESSVGDAAMPPPPSNDALASQSNPLPETSKDLGAATNSSSSPQVASAPPPVNEKPTVEDNIGLRENAKAVTIVVKRGDHLIGLLHDYYGFVDENLIELVRRKNPEIKDADVITPGQRILFPTLPGSNPHVH